MQRGMLLSVPLAGRRRKGHVQGGRRQRQNNPLLWGEAQDLEDGYYQELIAFILFLKRQTKAAFDFSSSAGRDKQYMVGGGLSSPIMR